MAWDKKDRNVVAILTLILVTVVGALAFGQGGPYSAEIESFWQVISNGGRTFNTLKANTIQAGATVSTGTFRAPDGAVGAPAYSFTNDATEGLWRNGAGGYIGVNGPGGTVVLGIYSVTTQGLTITGASPLSWAPGGIGNTSDTFLYRVAPGALTVSNTANTNGIRFQANGLPTLNTCVGATVVTGSTDVAGQVTSAATTCSINFVTTWPSNPFCTVVDNTGARALQVTTTTGVLTVAGLTALDSFMYHCIGSK